MKSFTSLVLETHFLAKLKTQAQHEASSGQLYTYLKALKLSDVVEILWGLKNMALNLNISLSFKENSESETVNQSATYSTSENSGQVENFNFCELSGDFSTIPERRINPQFYIGSIMRMETPVLDESVADITRENMLTQAMFNIPIYFSANCYGNVYLNSFVENGGYQYPYEINLFNRKLNLCVNTFEAPEKLQYKIDFSLEPEFYTPEDFTE